MIAVVGVVFVARRTVLQMEGPFDRERLMQTLFTALVMRLVPRRDLPTFFTLMDRIFPRV